MTDEQASLPAPEVDRPTWWQAHRDKLSIVPYLKHVRRWPAVAMFVESRMLTFATLLLAVVSLAPLFVTPFLPLVDLGSNVGAAMLLGDAAFGDGVVAYHYFVQPNFVPYWTGYLFLAVLEPIFGVILSVKIVIGFLILLLPIATIRLLVALGRSPLLGLWVFMLTWDVNLFWGWFTFQLGMGLAIWALAWVVEMKTYRDAYRLAILGVVIAATHVHSLAFCAVLGGLVVLLKRPFLPALRQGLVALSGFVLPLLPWVLASTDSSSGSRGYVGETHDLAHKVTSLHNYSLNNIPEEAWMTASAFLLVLIAPAILSAASTRPLTPFQKQAPIALLLGCLLLYLLLPYVIHSPVAHFWTYPRFATYILIALLLIPRVDFSGLRTILLLPGVALSVLINWTILQQFKGYGEYTKPYLKIIEALPHNSRFFPLDLDDFRYKGTKMPAIGQLHGYAAAITSSYDGHLFDHPSNPLRFRRKRILPHPHWQKPSSFNMKDHGKYHDYIIVHPTDRDLIARRQAYKNQVEEVLTSGPWRLYRVKEPQGRVKEPQGRAKNRKTE